MTADEPLVLLRQVLSDMNPSGRWTDPTLLNFIDRGNKRVVRDVRFPDSRLTASTSAAVQEYQLPQLILILRVYIAGQLCVPTDINTLEGHQIGLYQQDPSAPVPTAGTGGPPGAAGAYNPDWFTTTPLSYPVANQWQGYPAPAAQPWFNGQRPRYYLRGGSIGFVPAPNNVAQLTVDCIRVPDTVSTSAQVLSTPDLFCDAIVWGACTFAQFADDQERNAAMRKTAEETYQARMMDLRKFQKSYVGDIFEGPEAADIPLVLVEIPHEAQLAMASQDYKALLTLSEFKGLDLTSAGPTVKPGFAVSSENANPSIISGALSPERGRINAVNFAPVLASVSVVMNVQQYQGFATPTTSRPMYLAGGTSASSSAFSTVLWDPQNNVFIPCVFSGTVPSSIAPFDQAVQYGGVVYMNNGFRLFLNQPSDTPNYTLFAWNYPAPAAAYNIQLQLTTIQGPVATYASTGVASGAQSVVPLSMGNIGSGTGLVVDTGFQQEFITVTGTTASSFAATFAFQHDTGFGIWAGVTASSTSTSSVQAQYQYVCTRTSTMPDGTICETSVDLNQYQSPPTIIVGSSIAPGTDITVTPINGFAWNGLHTYDQQPYITNIYRQSTLQPGFFFVRSITGPTNFSFVDYSPDAAIIGNAQLQVNRDPPPCVPGTYGQAPQTYNFGSLGIHKNRVWVYAIVQDISTAVNPPALIPDIPEVQLWYSSLGRGWEFNQLNQVLALQSDIVNQYVTTGGPNLYSTTYDSPYGNDPLALCEVGSVLMAHARRDLWAIYGDDPSNFLQRQILNIGTVSRHSVTPTTGGDFWASENGPYYITGADPQWTAEAVRGFITATPASPPISVYDLMNSTGFFSNMTWYWAFPTLGYTLSYFMPTGTWLSQLPYAPATAAAVSFTPAYPSQWSASGTAGGINEVIAIRSEGGVAPPTFMDWYFADASNDLTQPQVFTWTGPYSWCGKSSAEKVADKLMVVAPVGSGTALVTLSTDQGAPTAFASTTAFNLANGPRQVISIGDGNGGLVRFLTGQLSVVVVGMAGQPAPHLWEVSAGGTIGREWVIPT